MSNSEGSKQASETRGGPIEPPQFSVSRHGLRGLVTSTVQAYLQEEVAHWYRVIQSIDVGVLGRRAEEKLEAK